MNNETAFNMASSNIRYGPGASLEIGMDLADMGAKNVMVVTDPNLAKLDFVSAILGALEEQSVGYTLFDQVRVEPTDASLKQAIDFAAANSFDAFVGIGGGSALDTAKAANLTVPIPPIFWIMSMPPSARANRFPAPSSLCWLSQRLQVPGVKRQEW
jgi:hydroxyacid-oxoacid transhydrogenase